MMLTDILIIINLHQVCSSKGSYWGSWMAWIKHPDYSRARASFCYIKKIRDQQVQHLFYLILKPEPPDYSTPSLYCVVFNSNDQMLVALKFKLTMYTFCFSDRLHVLCEFWTLGGISVWSLSFFQVFYFSFLKNYYFCVSCHFLASNFICYYYACC